MSRPKPDAARDGTPTSRAGTVRRRPDRVDVLVPLGLAVALAVLTAAVATRSWVTGLDESVASSVPAHGQWHALDVLSRVVTTLALPAGNVIGAAVIAGVLAWRARSWAPLRLALPALVLLTGSVLLGKALLSRPGPPGSEVGTTLGYFPSGHTTSALVCVGTVALLLARLRPRWRGWLLAVTAAWTVVVGWGLVWRHFHWTSDVVAGLLLGSLILWLVFRWPLGTRPAAHRSPPPS